MTNPGSPEYAGLFGEVVTEDCYRLRSLPEPPDVVFDIGANVGYFAAFAHGLFPGATIICVEPHPENYARLKQRIQTPKAVLLRKAIGTGQMWTVPNPINGAHAMYVSEGLGYPPGTLAAEGRFVHADVPCVTLADLMTDYSLPTDRCMVKLDCEGGENAVIADARSMELLRTVDYIAVELHFFAHTGGQPHTEVRRRTLDALHQLVTTHDLEFSHVMFYARKHRP
jgi:FkbM family methyltransferase